MVGHAFPVFAGFRGGRSILTFVGGAAVFARCRSVIAIGLLLVFAVTRSFAGPRRVGFVAFPIVQLVIEGPYRTAATGVLMTFIGVRFAMAALADRREGRGHSLRSRCGRARSGGHAGDAAGDRATAASGSASGLSQYAASLRS
jgi:hypothetical protein